MSVETKTNLNEVLNGLDLTDKELSKAFLNGADKGMRFFEKDMIRTQFSGRPGLKAQTGTAAGSWRIRKRTESDKFILTLANAPNAWYIIVHQTGKTIYPKLSGGMLRFKHEGQWRWAKKVTIPKRLYIPESFNKKGARFITTSVLQEAINIIKKRNTRGRT